MPAREKAAKRKKEKATKEKKAMTIEEKIIRVGKKSKLISID